MSEPKGRALTVTQAEARAALDAIARSYMLDGIPADFAAWQGTRGNLREWRALLRIEAKLREATG